MREITITLSEILGSQLHDATELRFLTNPLGIFMATGDAKGIASKPELFDFNLDASTSLSSRPTKQAETSSASLGNEKGGDVFMTTSQRQRKSLEPLCCFGEGLNR